MKRLFFSLIACSALASSAHAYTVSFDLEADRLRVNSSTTFPVTGLCLLVASTTDTSFSIKAGASTATGSFIDGGDDQILYRTDLSNNNIAGVLAVAPSIDTANFSANLGGNDPLTLYWFPGLTLSSTTIPAGSIYGAFTTQSTQDGGQAWTMPAAAASGYKLYFKTTDAVVLTGTHSPTEAVASQTVVPEPSTYAMMLLGGSAVGSLVLRRRRRLM